MRPFLRGGAFLLLALVTTGFACAAQARSCDRACLTKLTDQALAALMSGEGVAGARLTENGVEVTAQAGGLTKAKAIKFRNYFASPKDGAAGFYGTTDEGDRMAVFALRLKISNVPLGASDGWSRTSPLAWSEALRPSWAGEQPWGNRP